MCVSENMKKKRRSLTFFLILSTELSVEGCNYRHPLVSSLIIIHNHMITWCCMYAAVYSVEFRGGNEAMVLGPPPFYKIDE